MIIVNNFRGHVLERNMQCFRGFQPRNTSYEPEVKEFTLDTPVWNVRTNVFYSKLGYKEIKHDEESVFYIKYRGESS